MLLNNGYGVKDKLLLIMTQKEKERAIACIKLAIELAGDGGPMPFTEKEYELMYRFLDKIIL